MSDSTGPGTPPENVAGERMKEAERERIAKDLHDELGSRLTAIKMALAQLNPQLRPQLPKHDAARMQEQVRLTDQLVDDAIGAMHDIIDDLHPAVLDLGLLAALEWLTQNATKQTGIIHRMLDEEDLPNALLDTFQTVSLYRIAREALHNTSRHAAARNVSVSLRHVDALVIMEIVDDGVGLARDMSTAAENMTSSGIRGMQRRASAIGASLNLENADRGGVKLHVALPVLSTANLIE